MDFRIVGLPSFHVLGLARTGLAADAPGWVPKLWQETFCRRSELAGLSLGECWGLMGMPDAPLAAWRESGSYLAGWEVPRETAIPNEDWGLWTVPASAWIRVAVTAAEIPSGHEFLVGWLTEQAQWRAAGACHEHYPATFRDPETDRLHLCLPLALQEA